MLNNINKKDPFKVPENYFDNFHKELMDKIPQEKKSKIVPLWKKVIPWTAVAAVLSGILFFADIPASDPTPHFSSTENKANDKKDMFASTEEDDFYLFLEDEAARQAYSEVAFY